MVSKNGSHRQKVRLIQELADELWQVKDELSYEHAVASGNWPQSVEILERRLAKAKAKTP
jgi:hypothetical protein